MRRGSDYLGIYIGVPYSLHPQNCLAISPEKWRGRACLTEALPRGWVMMDWTRSAPCHHMPAFMSFLVAMFRGVPLWGGQGGSAGPSGLFWEYWKLCFYQVPGIAVRTVFMLIFDQLKPLGCKIHLGWCQLCSAKAHEISRNPRQSFRVARNGLVLRRCWLFDILFGGGLRIV